MGFRSVLLLHESSLTEAEQRIVQYLLASPLEASIKSAAQVAQLTSVHESSVIRLSQKLGYTRYADLRVDLQADVQTAASKAGERWLRSLDEHNFASIIQQEIQVLTQLSDFVTQDGLDEVAQALLGARRVFLYGHDFARTLVEFVDRRLRCMGFDVVDMRHVGRDVAEHLVSFTQEDVLLAFAFKKQPQQLGQLFHQVSVENGVSILITDLIGLSAQPKPTRCLAAPRGGGAAELHTLVVPLIICYGLEASLHKLAPDRISAALSRLDNLIQIYE